MKKGWRKYEEVGPKTGYTANSALVQNYEKAKADGFNGWCIHHRLETHDEKGFFRDKPIPVKELKEKGLYYNRPTSELIWLKKKDHTLLHDLSRGHESSDIRVYRSLLKIIDEFYGEEEWTIDSEKEEEYEEKFSEAKDRVLYLKTLGDPDQLQKPLDESTNNLNIIRMVLENLQERGIECPPIEQLYKREWNHNKRLTELIESTSKGE